MQKLPGDSEMVVKAMKKMMILMVSRGVAPLVLDWFATMMEKLLPMVLVNDVKKVRSTYDSTLQYHHNFRKTNYFSF